MTEGTTATTGAADAASAVAPPGWVVLAESGPPRRGDPAPRLRTVLLQLGAATLVVVAAVAVVGLLVSRRTAESESVHDAAQLTNVLADSVVQPALTDPMAADPAAAAGLDHLIRSQVLSSSLVRVKIWSPQGRILYSDEPRLVGAVFDLDRDARHALSDPQVSAAISDLQEPENRFERGRGTLLEVHRPVWTPSGRPLLFETYFRYDQVTQRAGELWRGFAGITLSSILAVVVLLVPLGWTLVARTRRAQNQREAMLQRAVDASIDERRRIAAALHDGVVQELVAASLAVGAGATDARTQGFGALAERLGAAGDAVRSSIGGMRSLLVDIYPPNLHDAGLPAALHDLIAGLRVDVTVTIDQAATRDLDPERLEALFRFAQEALRNAASHARADTISLTLHRADGAVVLEVTDDGQGFDPLTRPEGHFGLTLMHEVARSHGAELAVRTGPGAGTSWRMTMPA